MRWNIWLCAASGLLRSCTAIFADDAFQLDYHQALIGVPQAHATLFHKPQSASNASLLYTISDKNVLGAVNPRDGSLIWRQALESQPTTNGSTSLLVAGQGDGKIVTGCGRTVAAWDALDGKLLWTFDVALNAIIYDVQPVPVLGDSVQGSTQDLVVLAASEDGNSATISRIGGDGSAVRWQHEDAQFDKGSTIGIGTSPKDVFYITVTKGVVYGSKAKVRVLDVTSGVQSSTYDVSMGAKVLGTGASLVGNSGSGFPCIASMDGANSPIMLNLLGSAKTTSLTLEDKGEEIQAVVVHHALSPMAKPHLLVHVQGKSRHWAEVFHINPKTGEASKAYSLPATQEVSAFTASNIDDEVYFTRVTNTEVIVYNSESHGQLGRYPRRASTSPENSPPAHIVAEVVLRGKTGFSVRTAETTVAGSWTLVRNGETQWTRPEMLAYASIAAWADDVGQSSLADELASETSVDPLTAYIRRWQRHLHDLVYLPQYLQRLFQSLTSVTVDTTGSTREALVGPKSIVLATSRKTLIGMDASKLGALKWQTDLRPYLTAASDIRALTISDGRVTAYVSDGSLVVCSINTGEVIEHKSGSIPLTKLLELPGSPDSSIIKIGDDGVPQLSTDLSPPSALEGNLIVTLSDNGNAIGWSVGQTVERMWTLRPPSDSKFVDAVTRPAHDPIASVGKVLGDRSVLYKYLSPNLALLTAVSSSTLTIYLIEAITGAVLHTTSEEGVLTTQPIATVMSENWFVYSFTSQEPDSSGLASRLVVSELFEAADPNERGSLAARTNYSSFDLDVNTSPHVVSQSFSIAEPLSQLTTSQTTQGITTRQLLAYMADSGAVIGIPRDFLNPRRPVDRDPTGLEVEEGLMRYYPTLELDPKLILSHSREVMAIQKIMSSPTLLESTTMIFAFGHDIFGTQIAPSMPFDILGKGFNKIQLLLTVVALFVGVMAIRPMVRKNMVNTRWKN